MLSCPLWSVLLAIGPPSKIKAIKSKLPELPYLMAIVSYGQSKCN